jgi:arylsulfatase A-like enzyme
VCSPSRTAFLTSHFPARHEVHGHFATHDLNAARNMPDWLDAGVPTLPRLLKDAGYATGHFGKWHLGSGPGAPTPTAYGIDDHKTVDSSGPALAGEGKDPYFRAKSTRMIVDETIRFVRANKDKPFYVNVWTLLPHAPLNPTPEQLKVYEGLTPSASDPAFGCWRAATNRFVAQASTSRTCRRAPTCLSAPARSGRSMPARSARIRTASGNVTFSLAITKLNTLPPLPHPKHL